MEGESWWRGFCGFVATILATSRDIRDGKQDGRDCCVTHKHARARAHSPTHPRLIEGRPMLRQRQADLSNYFHKPAIQARSLIPKSGLAVIFLSSLHQFESHARTQVLARKIGDFPPRDGASCAEPTRVARNAEMHLLFFFFSSGSSSTRKHRSTGISVKHESIARE
jgi:hypothetical protein